MKTYTLKLKTTSTVNYSIYDGTTALTDAEITTLFTTAGSAYFTFDFDSLTPSSTTSLTIVDSNDTSVITNTGLVGIAEDKNFKGEWAASATSFSSFIKLTTYGLDEAQLSGLVGRTKNYVDTQIAGTTETLTIATSDWTALSASDPYDYSATVTATTTISATSTVELVNDQAVLFGTHGFAIGSVDTVNNTVTIYSIGVPSTSVSLTIKVRS